MNDPTILGHTTVVTGATMIIEAAVVGVSMTALVNIVNMTEEDTAATVTTTEDTVVVVITTVVAAMKTGGSRAAQTVAELAEILIRVYLAFSRGSIPYLLFWHSCILINCLLS